MIDVEYALSKERLVPNARNVPFSNERAAMLAKWRLRRSHVMKKKPERASGGSEGPAAEWPAWLSVFCFVRRLASTKRGRA